MYRVLYRKWRPRSFDDVIGQPQVTKTLAAQVRENRLSHAYLFTGSRGTGKTSCAKILSKAVNCLSPVNGSPCGECELCRGIDSGTVLDIVEIDAASNRGIDDIRLLRDEVNFMPAKAQYRVYIIDEVHMLTIEAFNALLKTLEEPPEHVIFILATTEVHKLPATILSRCQRFDFKRIEPDEIAKRLCEIAAAEGGELDFDAAVLIAGIADGGMRDALSLLDRALSVSGKITPEEVAACAGLMGREHIYRLVRAAAAADMAECLNIFDELHRNSCDTQRLFAELIDVFRSFLIIKTSENPEKLIVGTAAQLEQLSELAGLFTEEGVLYALSVLTQSADAMGRAVSRRVEAELALIKLCRPQTDSGVFALAQRVAELEKKIEELESAPPPVRSAPVKKESDFAGFEAEQGTSDFAAAFAAAEDEPEEAENADFDFDAFMSEHAAKKEEKDEINEAAFERVVEELSPPPAGDGIDSRSWLKVILETERSFPPLTGMLTGSAARIQGDALFIRLADEKIRGFCNEAILAKHAAAAAKRVLGREYTIKLE